MLNPRPVRSSTNACRSLETSPAFSEEIFRTSRENVLAGFAVAAIFSASVFKALFHSGGLCSADCPREGQPASVRNVRTMIARREKSRGRGRIGLFTLHQTLWGHHNPTPQTSAEAP